MSAPLFGVTGPVLGGGTAWRATRGALARAGARAVRLTARSTLDLDSLAGLVVGGGTDVDPRRYDSARSADRAYDPARDAFELSLLAEARERGWPTLAICRGAQLVNVAHGGSLASVAQVTGRPPRRVLWPSLRAQVVEDSWLARVTQSSGLRINALHTQCIDRLGAGLRITARAGGLVQAIERPGEPLLLGVQWHPEYLPGLRAQRRLWRALVQVAVDGSARQPLG